MCLYVKWVCSKAGPRRFKCLGTGAAAIFFFAPQHGQQINEVFQMQTCAVEFHSHEFQLFALLCARSSWKLRSWKDMGLSISGVLTVDIKVTKWLHYAGGKLLRSSRCLHPPHEWNVRSPLSQKFTQFVLPFLERSARFLFRWLAKVVFASCSADTTRKMVRGHPWIPTFPPILATISQITKIRLHMFA